jgi:hypothetical protein
LNHGEEMVELTVKDGKEYSSVRLHLESDGTIRIEGRDMGPNVKVFWDHDDHQYMISVAASAVGKPAFELLRDKFIGNLRAVEELRAFCNEHQVPSEWWSWP